MKARWQLWIGFILLLLFIYGTRGILLPFVAGLAIAYLLDPIADRLESKGCPRWLATALILAAFFVGVSGLIVAIIPIAQAQFLGFVEGLPRYFAALRPLIDSTLQRVTESFDVQLAENADSLSAALIQQGLSRAGAWIGNLFTQGVAFFNLLTLLIISPVVSFFLLRDWDLIIAKIDGWLPNDQASVVRRLASEIDDALAGFVRGQTVVVLILGLLYATGWGLVGLNYALVLGIIAGVLAYVPFAGALFAALIAMVIGFGQFGTDYGSLLQIFGVFVIVQLIEGTILTPRLIGSHVGLHPVWVLFAIFAGGELLGFVGVLISLPVAAATGVLVRYVVEVYLDSSLKLGKTGRAAASGEKQSTGGD